MKKLQNNFTDPEQSKRLLELGVPADSADCYFGSYPGHPDWAVIRQSKFDTEDDALFRINEDIIPCWSVGRLIEIYNECVNDDKEEITIPKGHIVLQRVLILFFAALQYKWLDFSKLED